MGALPSIWWALRGEEAVEIGVKVFKIAVDRVSKLPGPHEVRLTFKLKPLSTQLERAVPETAEDMISGFEEYDPIELSVRPAAPAGSLSPTGEVYSCPPPFSVVDTQNTFMVYREVRDDTASRQEWTYSRSVRLLHQTPSLEEPDDVDGAALRAIHADRDKYERRWREILGNRPYDDVDYVSVVRLWLNNSRPGISFASWTLESPQPRMPQPQRGITATRSGTSCPITAMPSQSSYPPNSSGSPLQASNVHIIAVAIDIHRLDQQIQPGANTDESADPIFAFTNPVCSQPPPVTMKNAGVSIGRDMPRKKAYSEARVHVSGHRPLERQQGV
jgi:hypothetical protein